MYNGTISGFYHPTTTALTATVMALVAKNVSDRTSRYRLFDREQVGFTLSDR
jgi:hypothetical protein